MKMRLLLLGVCCSFLQLFCFAQETSLRLTDLMTGEIINTQSISDSSVIFSDGYNFGKLVNNDNIAWFKRSLFSDTYTNYDIVKTSDSTFCAFGHTLISFEHRAALVVFDKNGVFKSSKSFASTNPFYRAIQMNKNYMMAFTETEDPFAVNSFILVKLDNNGNTILSKKMNLNSRAYIVPSQVALNKINENLFLVSISQSDRHTIRHNLATFAVDSSFNFLWGNVVGGKGNIIPQSSTDINGNHFIICQTNSYGVGMSDVLVICRNNSGTITWSKTFGTEQLDEIPLQVSMDKDSSLLISGYVKDTAKEKGLLLKITQTGEPIWARTYTAPSGYKNLRFYHSYVNQFKNICATISLNNTNNPNKVGFMELKPSGLNECSGRPLLIKDRVIRFNETPISVSGTIINLVETPANTANPNTPQALTTVCEKTCTTKANMLISKTRVCKGSSIQLTNTSSGYDSVSWLMDGLKISTDSIYSFVLNTPGDHTISLIAAGISCIDTLSVHVTVDSIPNASFSFTQQNLDGHFTNLSLGALTDIWQIGDGTVYYSKDAHHSFSKTGVYNVCLIASNVCSSDTVCRLFSAMDYSSSTLNALYHHQKPVSSTSEWATGICQEPNGNFLIAIDDHSPIAYNGVSIMKIDKKGKILNQGILHSEGLAGGKIFSLKERGYILLTSSGSVANGGNVFFLDSTLNFYTDVFYLENFSAGFALESVNKKDIYLAGRQSTAKGCVMKINEYGGKLWAKDLAVATALYGAVELKGGDVLIYGRTTTSGVYLARLNGTTGNMVWSKSFTSAVGLSGSNICYDPASDYVYMSGNILGQDYGYFIMKADSNGNIIWQKTLTSNDSYSYNVSCFLNQYNQLFLCHSSGYTNVISLLDTAGTIKWTKNMLVNPVGSSRYSAAYVLCHDGGIASTGSYHIGPNVSVSIIKTDTAGNSSSCAVAPISANNIGLLISADDNITDSVADHSGNMLSRYYYYTGKTFEPEIECYSNACSASLAYAVSSPLGLEYHFQPSQPSSSISNPHWDFGDGHTNDTYSPVHTFTSPGLYKVCLSGTLAGCERATYCDSIRIVVTNLQQQEQNESHVTIFPNPYRTSTTIQYMLPKRCMVSVQVFNSMGQLVKTLQEEEQSEGVHSLNYSPKKDNSSGLYFLRLTIDGKSIIRRMEELKY